MSRLQTVRPSFGRRALGGLAASAMFMVVAACGGGEDDSAAPAVSGAASTGSYPVSIDHKYGTAEIAKAPQRIVVVGLTEQDALLALGVVPVATTEWFGEKPGAIFPWASDKLGVADVPAVLTNTDGIQFEKVAALKPDLVVGLYSGLTQEDYTTLSKIAPTIAQPPGSTDFGASWDVVTATLGKAVGKSAEAEKLVADTKALVADAAAKNPDFAGKTGLVATTYEGYWVYGPQDSRGQLMESLGFRLPDGLAEVTGEEFGANISKERIDLLDTDALVWLVTSYAKDKPKVEADPLYAALTVAKEQRHVFLEDGETLGSATSFISVLSLPYILDNLVPQLAEAVDGNPATAVQRSPA